MQHIACGRGRKLRLCGLSHRINQGYWSTKYAKNSKLVAVKYAQYAIESGITEMAVQSIKLIHIHTVHYTDPMACHCVKYSENNGITDCDI
jgi:hypothetical protein